MLELSVFDDLFLYYPDNLAFRRKKKNTPARPLAVSFRRCFCLFLVLGLRVWLDDVFLVDWCQRVAPDRLTVCPSSSSHPGPPFFAGGPLLGDEHPPRLPPPNPRDLAQRGCHGLLRPHGGLPSSLHGAGADAGHQAQGVSVTRLKTGQRRRQKKQTRASL